MSSSNSSVFFSYSGQDASANFVALCSRECKKLNVSNFYDVTSIPPGSDFHEFIVEAVSSCDVFVVVLTPRYLQRYYCMLELQTALEKNSCTILPVYYSLLSPKEFPNTKKEFVERFEDHDCKKDARCMADWWESVSVRLPRIQGIFRSHYGGKDADSQLMDTLIPNIRRLVLPTNKSHGISDSVPDLDGGSSAVSSSSSSSCETDRVYVGVDFSATAALMANDNFNSQLDLMSDLIRDQLLELAEFGKLCSGSPDPIAKRIRVGWFSSRRVLRFRCRYKLANPKEDHSMVREILKRIKRLLKEAGASEDDVQNVMVGSFWRGSLCIMLDAPQVVNDILSKFMGTDIDDKFTLIEIGFLFAVTVPKDLKIFANEPTGVGYEGTLNLLLHKRNCYHLFCPDSAHARERFVRGVTPLGGFLSGDASNILPALTVSEAKPEGSLLCASDPKPDPEEIAASKRVQELQLRGINEADIGDSDVLFHRGSKARSHPGNMHYYKLIEAHLVEYASLQTKNEKMECVRKIVQKLRNKGIRFLTLDGKEGRQWSDVGDLIMRQKVNQSLRDQRNLKKLAAQQQPQQQEQQQQQQQMGMNNTAQLSPQIIGNNVITGMPKFNQQEAQRLEQQKWEWEPKPGMPMTATAERFEGTTGKITIEALDLDSLEDGDIFEYSMGLKEESDGGPLVGTLGNSDHAPTERIDADFFDPLVLDIAGQRATGLEKSEPSPKVRRLASNPGIIRQADVSQRTSGVGDSMDKRSQTEK